LLYINVYLIRQAYGGPEEGTWYYDIGTPLASIPVDSDYKPGKAYYLQNAPATNMPGYYQVGVSGGVVIKDCYTCSGTGLVEVEGYKERCKECGIIPEKPEECWKAIQHWQDFFKDTAGRREEIRVSLQEGFAQSFPDRKPHYE